MAPEIFEMQEYDAKADIWSVGCVFYEMLGMEEDRGKLFVWLDIDFFFLSSVENRKNISLTFDGILLRHY